LICPAFLTGCNKTINEALSSLSGNKAESSDETEYGNAVKLNKETKYYNDFLGISYVIPKGWWVYDLSGENFSEKKGDITGDVSMDIDYGMYEDYKYSNIWLASFGNLEKSTNDNHLGFSLDARSLEGVNDLSSFMKYFEIFMLEPTEEEEYTLLESQQITIKGKPFELRNYLVSREEDNFNVLTLSCQVKQGYSFNISVDYWPENTKAKQAIIDSVSKAVEFY